MANTATTPKEYIDTLPADRKKVVAKIRSIIKKNLPKGFKEEMNYNMLGYVVPHSIYPSGYHCDTSKPLPFMNIASQKNFIAVYHMGIYADKKLMDWFVTAYKKSVDEKLDMGKSCIRFKKLDTIPYDLLGELAGKMTPDAWIKLYEKSIGGRPSTQKVTKASTKKVQAKKAGANKVSSNKTNAKKLSKK